jgi:hypothetical protein
VKWARESGQTKTEGKDALEAKSTAEIRQIGRVSRRRCEVPFDASVLSEPTKATPDPSGFGKRGGHCRRPRHSR